LSEPRNTAKSTPQFKQGWKEAWDCHKLITPRITSSFISLLYHTPLNALIENSADSVSRIGQRDEESWTSDPFYPSPWMNPDADGWEEAYKQAKSFVSQLTLLEKVNVTTGVG
jgi:hypothetical protein